MTWWSIPCYWTFLTDIPPYTRHRNLNAWKGVSQRRSSATCVEGGGVVPVSSSQPPVDPWAGGGASVWSPPPPHSTHQLMGGRQAARTELSPSTSSSQLSNTLEPSERRSAGEIVDTHCSDSLLMSVLLFFFCGFLGNLENIKSSRSLYEKLNSIQN